MCTGFVIKVTRSYLHVGFYGNTFGVLSSGALALHGIMDPTGEFAVGQVSRGFVDIIMRPNLCTFFNIFLTV